MRIRNLGFLPRIGLTALVLTLVGGTAASGYFLYLMQENRDERPGLTINDVKAHYHGVTRTSDLQAALDRGHPESLSPEVRAVLKAWLAQSPDEMARAYNDPDALDLTPMELIERNCVSCHAPGATAEGAHPAVNLRAAEFGAIRPLTLSREIKPVDKRILALSTHVHALSLSLMGLVMGGLMLATRMPRLLTHPVACVIGLGLLADIGGWWLARDNVQLAWLVVAGGAVFSGGVTVAGLMVVLDCWLPRFGKPSSAG